jgi:microcystin-dependent protein
MKVALTFLAWWTLAASTALAATEIPYQGYLSFNGAAINVSEDLTFFAVTDPTDGPGDALWTETHTNVEVTAGHFSVTLGSITPFPAELFARDALYIGIQVGALSPVTLDGRQRLLAVPYAVDALPPGTILPYAGTVAPPGWALCAGQSLDTTTYSHLFAAIGYAYGGSGATFNAPDLRGRMPLGKDNMGGSSANRVTASQADNLGQAAGTQTAQVYAHTHPLPDHSHNIRASCDNSPNCFDGNDGFVRSAYGLDDVAFRTRPSPGGLGNTSSAGSTGATNMPPYLTVNYIIKL